MKKRTRKLLSALLCTILALTLLPVTAMADGGSGTVEPVAVDGMTFSYTDDAELVRLSSGYDGCPILIWKGHIQVTDEDSETTVLLNRAGSELLGKLRPVWKDAATGQEVEVDTTIDVTVPSDGNYYIGPVTAGTYTFTLEYTPEEGEPVIVLPELTATIDTDSFERITQRTKFNEAVSWDLKCAIVGEAEGQLYTMSMYADEADGRELAAIPVTADGDGLITLGDDPALLFAPYHYLGAMKHYGDTSSDETLLWDFGTGVFGAYHIEGNVQEGSMWVSGGTVERYGGATNADIRIMLTFGNNGAVTMYSPYMGHSDKYLRLAKNADESYVFTSKTAAEDARASYPVYLYRRYVEVTPVATETKYEYVGEALSKTYDGKAVTLPLDTILASQQGTATIEQPLNQTGLYGKYVMGVWYKIEDSGSTQITGSEISEIMDEESPWMVFALAGPKEPGDYQFVLQSAIPEGEEGETPVYLTLSFTISPSPAEEHTHTYGDWEPYDDDQHQKTCTAGDDTQYEDHIMSDWADDMTTVNAQSRFCSTCGYWERRIKENTTVTVPEQTNEDGNLVVGETGDETTTGIMLPGETINDINTNIAGNETTVGATIVVGTTSVTYDAAAVEAINTAVNTAAGNNSVSTVSVTLVVEKTTDESQHQMNDNQQTAVDNAAANATGVSVFNITLEVNTTGSSIPTVIDDFNGGTATVTVPYEKPEGSGDVQVQRVEEDGSTTNVPSSYDAENQTVTWTTSSHSFYMIIAKPATRVHSGGGSGSASYGVSADKPANGSVTVNPAKVFKGDTVTVTATPDKGYTLETITVTDGSGKEIAVTEKDGKYTFAMPAANVTVKATFMEDNTMLNFFTDVSADAYYYDAVLWAVKYGITDGTSETTFSPNANCTRGQIVTFLWKAAGSPEPKSLSGLSDVPADAYYAKAVAWALENGITSGTGNQTFSPNAACTRAQAVTFLYHASNSPAVSSSAKFTDVAETAYYADAVAWAAEHKITSGIGGGLFAPDSTCTRGQIVTFLYHSMQLR